MCSLYLDYLYFCMRSLRHGAKFADKNWYVNMIIYRRDTCIHVKLNLQGVRACAM